MAGRSRVLRVELIGDASKLNRTLDHAERRAGKFGGAFAKLGGALGGALAGGAVLAGVKKVTDAGKDLNETTNKLGLAFGRNAGVIQAWAKDSARNMGLPKQAALESASTFGLLFSKIGVGAGESAKMSKAMVQLAVDLGSVHNADPTQIIEAQTAAFRGEYDSLQKFVPAINAAAVEQEALAQTGKRNAKSLTDAEKAQAVYSIMLKQTTKEQGDFARTADDAANKTKINQARFEDLQANIGTALLPAVTALTNGLGNLADWVENNRGKATALGVAIVAVTGFVLAMSAATKVSIAVQAAAKGAAAAWTAAQWLLNAALTANPIGLVIVAIAALAAGIVIAYKRSETFREVVRKVFDFTRDKVGAVVSFIISAIRGWLTVQFTVVEGILRVMGKLPGPMGAPFRKAEEAVRKAKETVTTQLDKIQERINKLRGKDIPVTASLKLNFSPTFTQKDWVQVRLAAGRMAEGGMVRGPGGPTEDRIPALLSAGEFVVNAAAVRQIGVDRLKQLNAMRFAAGGPVDRIDAQTRNVNKLEAWGTSRRMDAGITKLLSSFGAHPPHVPGGWQVALNFLRTLGIAFQVISTFRPGARTRASGAVSFHALNRAVDLAGPNMLAIWAALGRTNPSELIYSAAPWYISRRGRRPIGALDPITLADHWSHVHAAYGRGGLIPEDVVGVGRSGRTYGFHGGETVTPAGGAINVTVNIGTLLGGDVRRVARELGPAIQQEIREDLRRRGKPVPI